MKLFRHSLMFHHSGLAAPAVATELMLAHPAETGYFGSYRFVVRLDGRAVGGHLIIFDVVNEAE